MTLPRLASFMAAIWLVALSACSAQPTPLAVTNAQPLATSGTAAGHTAAPTGVSAAPMATTMLSGETYLLLRTASPPYIYQLASVRSGCLVVHIGCAGWKLLPTLPGSSYSPGFFAPLAWSPDNKLAVFQNLNTMQSFSFDPLSQTFTLLANLPLVTDQVVWSPDSQWAAMAVQGDDSYSSHVVLLNAHSGQVKNVGTDWGHLDALLGFLNLTRMQFPVGWLNANELLLFSERYQPNNGPGVSLSSKKVIAAGGLFRLNVQNGSLTALAESPDWTSVPSLAPPGNWVAIPTQTGLSIQAVSQLNPRQSQVDGWPQRWSPDGQWLASINPAQAGYELDFIPAGSGSTRKIQLNDRFHTMGWLPDNDHVLVATLVNNSNAAADRGSLLLVSLADSSVTPVDIPALDLNAYVVDGLSIRP
jgi:hypothetical protein